MKTAFLPPTTLASCSVLLVDDDRFQQTVLGDMLRDLGVTELAIAADGAVAIAACGRTARLPDVVLCDLAMPGADGFSFMEELGKLGYAGSVIVVSGMDARTMNSAQLMGRFHGLHLAQTLSKPVNPAALRAAMEQALVRH